MHDNGERGSQLPQSGERALALSDAYRRGTTAVRQLGLDFEISSLLDADPGAWVCQLSQNGRPVPRGIGGGKGAPDAARVGALFEAVEHHLSGLDGIDPACVRLRAAHALAAGDLAADGAMAMLAEGGNGTIACWPLRSLAAPEVEVDVPVFLSVPDYAEDQGAALRRRLGDSYDYTQVGRYASNSGWAAGSDSVEAAVHALNEAIERDALSLLLVDQFLGQRSPLRIIARQTLPADLASLLDLAEQITGSPVHLIDMTTELNVPAILAFLPPEPGQPRGSGAAAPPFPASTPSPGP